MEKTARRRTVRHSQAVFHALGDAMRFRAFRMLLVRRGICVSEIAMELNISIPAASYHLKMLAEAGLIRRERQGKKVCYVVRKEDPLVKQILRLL